MWKKILKRTGIAVGAVVLLLAAIITVALMYLTPARLTPLVNRYASEYLDADVNARRELTFWSTFPRLNLQIDTLGVVSRTLRVLGPEERASLPSDADSLLSLERLSGGIHLLKILKGDIDLYDVELTNPRINLYAANDSVNNYNIVPPSEESDEESKTALPELSINRFAINGIMPVRYRAPADSIDFTLTMTRTALDGSGAPSYTMALTGDTRSSIGSMTIPSVPFSIDGEIDWDIKTPYRAGLKNFTFSVPLIALEFDALVDMAEEPTVEEFNIRVKEVEPGRIIGHLPEKYTGALKDLRTDLKVSLEAKLLKPYRPLESSLPRLQADVQAEATYLDLGQMHLNSLDLDMGATIDEADADRSVIDLRRLAVNGRAMNFSLRGTVRNPVSDPLAEGKFRGEVSFNRLPPGLLDKLPCTLSGLLRGEADFRLRAGDLTPKRFHRIRIDGDLSLNDFTMAMRDSSMDARIGHATFNLGTNSKGKAGQNTVDSLLTASLRIDTVALNAPGIHLNGRRLQANVGVRNVASSTDTTQINPLGVMLKADLLTLSADSPATRIRLREATAGGILHRYNSEARSPQLDLGVKTGRLFYRSSDLSASLRNADGHLTLHPRSRKPMSGRMRRAVDSLATVYPHLSTDSLTSLARRHLRRPGLPKQNDGRENIDFGIDNSMAAWLRSWQLTGEFTAERAGLYTPHYPVRNRLTDVDVAFSTDSVIIRHTHMKSGKSDFTVDGAVRNISRALTSKRHVPIEVELNMRSDTIDVNDITAALIRGAAHSTETTAQEILAAADEDAEMHAAATAAATAEAAAEGAAVLVPSNVKARMKMSARHILYGDIWLRDFAGEVNVFDGAVSLNKLQAFTDIGSVEITALYSAPTADEIHVAAGLNLSKLAMRQLMTHMPQLDTIVPMLKDMDGIVDARLALSSDLDTAMNLRMSTLDMALHLSGDSLVLLDSETFRTVAKWMMFKNKKRNMIDHMDVEMTVHGGWMNLYPVVFDMDRYRLGVVGNNDLNFNLDYHVAVLKSPLPFKFGINIKGTPENMKIRLGKARLNEKSAAKTQHLTDSMRVNLLTEMRNAFRRGLRHAGTRGLRMQDGGRQSAGRASDADTISGADSLIFIREGLIAAPEKPAAPDGGSEKTKKDKKKKKK